MVFLNLMKKKNIFVLHSVPPERFRQTLQQKECSNAALHLCLWVAAGLREWDTQKASGFLNGEVTDPRL